MKLSVIFKKNEAHLREEIEGLHNGENVKYKGHKISGGKVGKNMF